jgi:hypothetical protein
MTLQSVKDPATDLGKTIALLSDIHEALKQNSYLEEARLVSRHLEQLSSPQFETRIEAWGIEPVLEELAQGFFVTTTEIP